jgi:hypothetical protein
MFMAEKLITTEEVQKQSNMAFKMRSGNKVSFKNMGSSPARNMKDGSYEHSFESPAKQGVRTVWDPKSGITEEEHERRETEGMNRIHEIRKGVYNKNKKKRNKKLQEIEEKQYPILQEKRQVNEKESPAKQRGKTVDLKEWLISERGFTPEDADKMIEDGAYTKKDIKPGIKRPVVKKDTPHPTPPRIKQKPISTGYEKMVDPKAEQSPAVDGDYKKYDDDRPVSPNKQKIQRTKELAPSLRVPRMKSHHFLGDLHEVQPTQQMEMPQQAIIKTPIIPDYHTVKEKGKKKMISTTPQSDYYDPTYKRRTKAGKLATKVANVFRSDKKDKNVNVRKKKK